MICATCRADLGRVERVGRRETCSKCGADLHTCRNCRFYDPRVYNECHETQAERVLDKTRSNFCDYFSATEAAATTPSPRVPQAPGKSSAAPNAREDLERLFRRR